MTAIGSGLGAAGFFVLDDQTDPVAVAAAAARFLAVESCGQCEPCKRDGLAIAAILRSWTDSDGNASNPSELEERLATVTDGARCYLAHQQERVVRGALALFPEEFEAHRAGRRETATELILPIVDIVDGEAVLDTAHLAKQPDWSYAENDSGEWPAAALGDTPVTITASTTGAARAVPSRG